MNYMEDMVKKLREQQNTQSAYYNWLLYGGVGTGKTVMASTAATPILVYSFDPGGWSGSMLKAKREGGEVLIHNFEQEDVFHPHCFKDFEDQFDRDHKNGVFASFRTVVIDSLTSMADVAMHYVLKKEGKPATTPTLPNYLTRQVIVLNVLRAFCALPCDFVLTGHVTREKDEFTRQVVSELAVSKGLGTGIPPMFDEIMACLTVQKANGEIEYKVLTRSDGEYNCRTRLGTAETFAKYESPNIQYLRRKAGQPAECLPKLW